MSEVQTRGELRAWRSPAIEETPNLPGGWEKHSSYLVSWRSRGKYSRAPRSRSSPSALDCIEVFHPTVPQVESKRTQRQMYEQTLDPGRRRRLQRLVLLSLHMGYDNSSPRKYGCRARLQPSCPRGLREAQLPAQSAGGCIVHRKTTFHIPLCP